MTTITLLDDDTAFDSPNKSNIHMSVSTHVIGPQ